MPLHVGDRINSTMSARRGHTLNSTEGIDVEGRGLVRNEE